MRGERKVDERKREEDKTQCGRVRELDRETEHGKDICFNTSKHINVTVVSLCINCLL